MEKTTGFREMFLRLVAIVGLVAVLVLGAWGIIIIASNLAGVFGTAGSSISSLFGGTSSTATSAETLVVTAPDSVMSGKPITVSWTHTGHDSSAYGYTVAYSCATNLSMLAPLPNGSVKHVACDTPFNFTNANNSITLTPSVTGSGAASTMITVTAQKLSTSDMTATGNTNVTVTPKTTTTVHTTTTYPTKGTTYTYVPAKVAAVRLYGLPDLMVRIIGVTPQAGSYMQAGGRTSVQFEIVNIGTNTAQAGWNFNAQLPLNPTYTYQSQTQRALNPGDKVVYTLGFDTPYFGGYNYNGNCNLQTYPYQNCYNNTYPQNYYNTNTCYTYNGYTNIPAPCTGGNTYNNQYNYNGYNMPIYTGGRTVTITVDPNNWVLETAEYNNTATISI